MAGSDVLLDLAVVRNDGVGDWLCFLLAQRLVEIFLYVVHICGEEVLAATPRKFQRVTRGKVDAAPVFPSTASTP